MIIKIIASFIILVFIFNFWIYRSTRNRILEFSEIPQCEYALVLGAGLEKDSSPTDILSDRVISAVYLINRRKIERLLMSGSTNNRGYDEADAMKILAVNKGIDPKKIEMDRDGISTLASLINFKKNFDMKDVIIITQRFHIFRALWLAKLLDLNCYGYPSSNYQFSRMKIFYWSMREFAAAPFNLLKFLAYFIAKRN